MKNSVRASDPRKAFRAFFFELTHKKEEDEWAVVCPCGLGDTYMVCGLAETILARHGGTKFTVYVQPSHAFIPRLFPKITSVKTISLKNARSFSHYGFSKKNIFYGHYSSAEVSDLIGYKNITMMDCYRALLQLPQDTKISTPRAIQKEETDEARNFFIDHSLKVGKTAIITPQARSASSIGDEMVLEICRKLERLGWSWIIFDKKSPIPQNSFNAIAELAGWVITARSGIADIVSHNSCRLTVLYPREIWHGGPLIKGTSLRAMGLRDNAEEWEILDEPGFIDRIIF